MSEAVSFPMTALPKGLAPARAKRKPGMSLPAGHGKFRLLLLLQPPGSQQPLQSMEQVTLGELGQWGRGHSDFVEVTAAPCLGLVTRQLSLLIPPVE